MQIQGAADGKQALSSVDESKSAELGRLVATAREEKQASTDEAAGKAFEKYFSTMLVKELRKALPGGFFSGVGSDVYSGWFDEHLGAALSDGDALGIAGLIKTSLARSASADAAALESARAEEAEEAEEKPR